MKGFNVVFFPDTQNETQNIPAMFQSQVDWIVNNRASQKIAYVGHLGDITDNGNTTEYTTAANIMFQLNDVPGLPWGTAPGNHDIEAPTRRELPSVLRPANFAGKEWYGDSNS